MRPAPTEPVTILRPGVEIPGEFDSQGFPVIGPDVEIVSAGWRIAPRSSDESAGASGMSVVTGLTIYNRAQVVILSSDRIVARGETWSVDGDVAAWHNGVVVNLKRGS